MPRHRRRDGALAAGGVTPLSFPGAARRLRPGSPQISCHEAHQIPWHRSLRSEGARCPFCGSDSLVADSYGADGAWSTCEVVCHGCGRSWKDVMFLVDMADVRDRGDRVIAE